VFDTSGKFPGSLPAVLMTPYVQAHHIDLDWYDKYLGKHSYLTTHKDHIDNWHDSQPENGRS
jgi:hypothetical protein